MKNRSLFLLTVILLSSCATAPPALKGGQAKRVKRTRYYQTFLHEPAQGPSKKATAHYRHRKKPSPLTSLINL